MGVIEDVIKEKVIKSFNAEKDSSDIEHYIDDDGYGFYIKRKDGSELIYDGYKGNYIFHFVKKEG